MPREDEGFFIHANFGSFQYKSDYEEQPSMVFEMQTRGCGCCTSELDMTKGEILREVNKQIEDLEAFKKKVLETT